MNVKQRIDDLDVKARYAGIVSDDPIGLSKKLESHGGDEESIKKGHHLKEHLYMDLVAAPLLLVVAIIFFLVATMDGKVFGTPDDELDNLINDRMKELMSTIDKDYGKSDNNLVGDSFDKVVFALRLVPSLDNEDFIMQLMNSVGGDKS